MPPVDEETELACGRLTRRLRDRGELLGTNDLWIASSALRHGLPPVTADTVGFRRVPELELVACQGWGTAQSSASGGLYNPNQ